MEVIQSVKVFLLFAMKETCHRNHINFLYPNYYYVHNLDVDVTIIISQDSTFMIKVYLTEELLVRVNVSKQHLEWGYEIVYM